MLFYAVRPFRRPTDSPSGKRWNWAKSADDYREALRKGGFRVGQWANNILGKAQFTGSTRPIELALVNVSVGELDFKDGACFKNICTRGMERGLELCVAEIGPALRVQYKDQPPGEWLRIAMQTIEDSGSYHDVFTVDRKSDELWLDARNGHPDLFWGRDNRFIFVRPES